MNSFEAKLEAMLRADHERAVAYALCVQYIADSNAARIKQLSERIAGLETAQCEAAMIMSVERDANPAWNPYTARFPALKRGISTKLRQLAFVTAVISAFLGTSGGVRADTLAGSWSGGGWVSFAGGSRERARCRARYSTRSVSSYALNATCATASGSVTQDASLRRVGNNSYAGTFYNSEYNISGTIHVTVRGDRQSVTIDSDNGSASISLSR